MARARRSRAEIVAQAQMRRMRTDRLYGPGHERALHYLRLPNLHPDVRLRLLSTIFAGGTVNRHVYHFWFWAGRWTWGIGIDREGAGLYLGPFSAWLVWSGR